MKIKPFYAKLLLIVFSFGNLVILDSCNREFPRNIKDIHLIPGNPVILVGGFESNGKTNVAKYWMDGQEEVLSDGTNDAVVNALYVSGYEIYAAGNDGGAVYWKNMTEVKLASVTSYSTANSIFVSGKDVYVSGNDNQEAVYWKNGNEVFLNNDNLVGYAFSIFVSGNDVYVAGTHNFNAVYWKNGVEVPLTTYVRPPAPLPISSGAVAYSIFISGGNIHIAGENVFNGDLPVTNALYWKNSVTEALNYESNVYKSSAKSVFVKGNNVFVAGNTTSIGPGAAFNSVYWKNGTEVILNSSVDQPAQANAIYVLENVVYVAGFHFRAGENQYAVYWKNGMEVRLTDGSNIAIATSVFVK